MKARHVERLLWGAATALVASALIAWRGSLTRPLSAPSVIWPIEQSPVYPPPNALDSAVKSTTRSNPFRLERRPSSVAYGTEPEGASTAPPPPKPPKPKLALAGIVGGPPWIALVDGIPGRNGSVLVHAGDTLAGLRVRSLGPKGVTITGLDTTWKLKLKKPWQ
jgi:hypothetical protein